MHVEFIFISWEINLGKCTKKKKKKTWGKNHLGDTFTEEYVENVY